MTQAQILDAIETRLNKHQPKDFKLIIQRSGVRHDGGWWYVIVEPSDPEARASTYNHAVAQTEEEMEDELGEKVLLVPALVD